MWYMPSYGRPGRLRELLDAPGGWPEKVIVLVNKDDPEASRYHMVRDDLHFRDPSVPWEIVEIPEGSRCADAHRYISETWPDDPFYGLLCDDHWPITPNWHQRLVEAAGKLGFATPNGEPSFPRIRNALVIGGDTARAMGSLVPLAVKHNYEDDVWDQIAEDFSLLRPIEDVYVEHRHWVHSTAGKDKTYERGSSDADEDRKVFERWKLSKERRELNERLAPLTGTTVATLNPEGVRLAIAVPIQNETVDLAYHKSLNLSLRHLVACGIAVTVFEVGGGSHVGKARERALWNVYRTNPTHILWIDADMGWKPEMITRLLCADHEFCGIPGVKKQDEVALCMNIGKTIHPTFHPRTKFVKAQDVGFAFVMLKVSVVDKLCAAYPELEYNAGSNKEFALFLDMIDEDRERLSEDFSFCRRWTKIGGEIWLDPESALIHAGRKEYTGKIADFFQYEKPIQ